MKACYQKMSVVVVATLMMATLLLSNAMAVVYTPPGPGSANPAIQPDGIMVPDVFGSTPNWNLSPPLRKFIDTLPGLGSASANNLGQYIPVAVPDKLTFPGSDYYEIEIRRYTEKVHSDLPNATTFQGYVQVNNGTNVSGTANTVAPAPNHYLGPVIVAQKDRPVRIKFVNKLPLENTSPFFLPVDLSVMGAGMGAKNADGTPCDPVWDPRGRTNPVTGLPFPSTEPACANYPTNRAELHLHGGLTPWISDGTPHQWITPAGESSPYKKGDSVEYVPDMWFDANGAVIPSCAGQLSCAVPGASINPGDGAQTYYYTNGQSARLMFYHDHSYGITRLNVYAGEAAGYMIQDPTEIDLITRGVLPADQIPLVIQDKAFVDASTIETLDPTWVWGTGTNKPIRWLDATGIDIASCSGSQTCNVPGARKLIGKNPKTGDLWWPHVYMPAENPSDLGGVNPLGRWVYGMYFWPPTTGIKFLPIANPYYDCDPLGVCNSPWEPPTMPATPNPSWVAEAFVDTPLVNGTAYPKLNIEPKSYRLRILNASHDRFLNLQLYEADTSVNANSVNPQCATMGGCATNTEVKMVPAIQYPAFPLWDAAADQRVGGVPDPAKAGPAWIQIGNEGGFLATPVVIPNQPISFVLDPTLFNVGNVNDGTVILGPAERADVVIDFSQYAGKTLILYNDAPAAFPAFVPNNDYYTDAPDASGSGGHPGPKAGIGPNTRTIMQINVAASAPAPAFDLNKLISEFTTTPTQDSVFKKSQEPIIVGQTAYNSAYNVTFPAVAPYWGIVNIGDQNMSFATLNPDNNWSREVVSQYPLEPKALHDEMGAVWDEFGRMSAKLGVELPNTTNINQIFVMQNYVDLPTENMQDGKVQIWKLTHNGVDTHPLHFHLFDVQVINRVGWDGFVRQPWPNELGWKETVRVSPLEDTIVAMRPKAPPVPWSIIKSNRLMNPTYPVGTPDGFMNLDPATGLAKNPPDTNQVFNFADEYVWHCHILSHEEQDMMRALTLQYPSGAPLDPSGLSVTAAFQKNTLSWKDESYKYVLSVRNVPQNPPSNNITHKFFIERCDGVCDANTGVFSAIDEITMIPSANLTYNDGTVAPGATYTYRIRGYNRFTTDNPDGTRTRSNGYTNYIYAPAVTSQIWPKATGLTLQITTETAPVTILTSPFEAPAKFVAQASGSTAPYQYRFTLNDGTTTTLVQAYGTTRFWTLPAGTTPGNYTLTVDVRTNAASPTPDISTSTSFTLLPTLDITPPITTAIPAAGAFLNPVQVYLQANEPNSIIRYTIDGTTPTPANSIIYGATPVNISATTTLKYYATDAAGNAEAVQSGLYELRPINLQATVKINNGATITNNLNTTLTITATGASKMRVYNDIAQANNSALDEPFISPASKPWVLSAGPDGLRTVYVRFTDINNVLQDPVIAQITVDTTAPVTTPMPAPGTFLTPVMVSLTADHPTAVIKYTTNGSDPAIAGNGLIYTGPFQVSATTAVKFFAIDDAGNVETVKTAIYTIHTGSLTVTTFNINGGAGVTNSTAVTLNINATEPTGVTKMRFSNDGVTYPAGDIPYATSALWTLAPGDGIKNVYVRFTDGAGLLHNPVTAQITLDTTPPVTAIFPPPAGTYVNPISVVLTPNETATSIKYTLNGSDPLQLNNPAATLYSAGSPIIISANTVLKYSSTDVAGNKEPVNTATYTFTSSSISASLSINSGATLTNTTAVSLVTSASGATSMQFSNDGVNYSTPVPYATTPISWILDPADGSKTVFARFLDNTGFVLNVVSAQITLDTTVPITTPTPAPGTFIGGVNVTLATGEPGTTILYTLNGSDPANPINSPLTYTGPISITGTTLIRYYAVDAANNKETVKNATYTITSANINASIAINNGATITNNGTVSLMLNASGVNKMSFSDNGISYSTPIPYAVTTTYTLPSGDGLKTVYVKFSDSINNLTYEPVLAQITLDTTAPFTTASPAAGTYISSVVIALTASEPGSTIRYTLDGSDPLNSGTAVIYSQNAPIQLTTTATLRYYATDAAGNIEVAKSGMYTVHSEDLTVSNFSINGGATTTTSPIVTLNISATDTMGITSMRFSNDGVVYSSDEPYATTRNNWALSTGDGIKTVFVRFTDGAGILYNPTTAQIILDTKAPTTTATPNQGSFIGNISVALTSSEPGSTITYTVNGDDPKTSSNVLVYDPLTPIAISNTTTIKYFATDVAGNQETVKSGVYTIKSSSINAHVIINNGATITANATATLALSASGVDKMSFSNNGVTYTTPEPYGTSKNWLLSAGDGVKTVFVRFHDTANGLTFDPVTAQVTLDTTAPTTSVTPSPGIYISQVSVSLEANETSTIKYTLNGENPTTSVAAMVYNPAAPINLTSPATIRYFAVDAAGNAELVKTAQYTVHSEDLTVDTFTINSGVTYTTSPNVSLTISATDAMGISKMRFSNDGVNYSTDEPYATSKSWVLSPGDGIKTVFVRFTDGAGILYGPTAAQITLDTSAPTVAASPQPGTFISAVSVTLKATEAGSSITYTTDGSDPAVSPTALLYSAPVAVAADMTLKYFATDAAGNKGTTASGFYEIHTGDLVVNTFAINNGAASTSNTNVTLAIDATDSKGVTKMRFSNDGISYTTDQSYATSKAWTVPVGDGLKTVYVRFTDGAGILYDPVIATIVLDTTVPVTSVNPPSGTTSFTPFSVTLNATDGTGTGVASIRYTTDGSDPLTSVTAAVYNSPIAVGNDTEMTLRFYATDATGNTEGVRTATYKVTHSLDLQATVAINAGAAVTISDAVTLNISATDSSGVSAVQYSNDGVSYSAFEALIAAPNATAATSKPWDLIPGEGLKTVYVKFKDGSGNVYGPYTTQVTLAFKNGLLTGTTSQLASAMKALQIAKGNITATPIDLAHADVAPFMNGTPQPDGKIDLGDVYVLLLNLVGAVHL